MLPRPQSPCPIPLLRRQFPVPRGVSMLTNTNSTSNTRTLVDPRRPLLKAMSVLEVVLTLHFPHSLLSSFLPGSARKDYMPSTSEVPYHSPEDALFFEGHHPRYDFVVAIIMSARGVGRRTPPLPRLFNGASAEKARRYRRIWTLRWARLPEK